MKKIVTFILLMGLVLAFSACTNNATTTPSNTTPSSTTPGATVSSSTEPESTETGSASPEITVQEIYDAGKNHIALLGEHQSVYLVYTYNGKVTQEDYYNKEYFYSFYDGEYFEWGADVSSLVTDHAEYVFTENIYALNVSLSPSGMEDIAEFFPLVGTSSFISEEILEDDVTTITEENGVITVTFAFEQEELAEIYDDIISCVETYTLNATTREMISTKTVYTHTDGTVDEGIVTITRNAEMPPVMKKFVEYDKQTEDLRTITIVSNPGADNENTQSIQIPKGLQVGFSPQYGIEETFTLYADAACTQTFPEDWSTETDLTFYVKWEQPAK